MTPAELYHLYRYDEPTRLTQDYIRMGLFAPTPASMPIIEQTMPRSIIRQSVINEMMSEPIATMRPPRTKRRKRR